MINETDVAVACFRAPLDLCDPTTATAVRSRNVMAGGGGVSTTYRSGSLDDLDLNLFTVGFRSFLHASGEGRGGGGRGLSNMSAVRDVRRLREKRSCTGWIYKYIIYSGIYFIYILYSIYLYLV